MKRYKLIEARNKKGKTQFQASQDLGIAQQTLSHIELGVRTPRMERAYEMAKYYDSTVQELFTDIFK